MTGRNNQRRAQSAPRGKTMQQRMAEARERRAEVLALQKPANDREFLPKTEDTPGEPAAVAQEPSPAPRFPEIVMPSDTTSDETTETPPKGLAGWLPLMVVALLGAIVGTLYLLPYAEAPLTTQSVSKPVAPEQTSRINRPASDTPAGRADTIIAMLAPPLFTDQLATAGNQQTASSIAPATDTIPRASLNEGFDGNARAPLLSIRPNPRSIGIDPEQLSKDIDTVVRTATQ